MQELIKGLLQNHLNMIVGFNVNRVNAEKAENVQGDVQINYVPNIKDVSSVSVPAFDEPVAKIEFSFKVEYKIGESVPAHIEMGGNILWNQDTENVVETWQNQGDLPENIRAPLMNDMYRKLLSEATGISQTLNMLPPIPTPQVQQNQ